MTTQQLHLFNALYLVVLVVVIVLTRATARRIAGALAGGAAIGVVALVIITLCQKVGWWHMVIIWEPYFLTLVLIDFTLCAFVFLITWRIARRFGWRGLGGGLGRAGGHWAAAGLLVHEAVPRNGAATGGSHPSWLSPRPMSYCLSWGTG